MMKKTKTRTTVSNFSNVSNQTAHTTIGEQDEYSLDVIGGTCEEMGKYNAASEWVEGQDERVVHTRFNFGGDIPEDK